MYTHARTSILFSIRQMPKEFRCRINSPLLEQFFHPFLTASSFSHMRLLPLVIFFVFLTSCVDQYDANSIYQANIVVEGMITDQPGPYLVKISKSAPVTS